jgi:DNA-3-methyladenine glycosylase
VTRAAPGGAAPPHRRAPARAPSAQPAAPSPGPTLVDETWLVRARLPPSFYARPVLAVARACIGKVLVHRDPAGVLAGRIVEAEAYRGPADLAAHSAGGRRTRRTEAMFGPPGRAYMYFLYGMHWAFNLVTGAEGHPHAVLIRALEPLLGQEVMAHRRGLATGAVGLCNGPGKLCQAFGLDGGHYGVDLSGDRLWLAEPPPDAPRWTVGTSPRINVAYAGEWAERPWRFFARGHRAVSVPPRS